MEDSAFISRKSSLIPVKGRPSSLLSEHARSAVTFQCLTDAVLHPRLGPFSPPFRPSIRRFPFDCAAAAAASSPSVVTLPWTLPPSSRRAVAVAMYSRNEITG